MLLSSGTFLEGLRRVLPYQRVLAHGRVVTLHERGQDAVIAHSRVKGDLPVTRDEVEFLAVMLARLVAGDVRSRVLLRLRAQRPVGDVDDIAAELHLGARTLQRRLAGECTSFSSVVDEARRDLAIELLDDDATIEHVASAVGFSDPSALVRAFKRWTGRSPGAHRVRRARSAS